MELVSIIIPIYNVEEYLNRCISSVVAQTYQNIDIILVDDGSTDQSSRICDEWAQKDNRIQVIHQKNGGVSCARNTGLETAVGEWIVQVDSDDYIAPQTIESMIHVAEEADADMVICEFEKGTDTNYQFLNKESTKVEMLDGIAALYQIYKGDHNALRFGVPWCKLCKKELYKNIEYPKGKIFEDIYTTHKLLYRSSKVVLMDESLFYYFQRTNSIMNATFSIKKLDYLQALVERVEFFESHELFKLRRMAYDELLHSLIWEYSRTRDLLNNEEGMEYVTELFRKIYIKGYSSQRYSKEKAWYLNIFYKNPEWIILYWKITGKLKKIFIRNE